MHQLIGSIIGNYRILRKIGEGGMGAVFLARDLSLEREVAIKIISPELARSPELMARFRVEAIAQAKLNHHHIVTIHSFDQEKNTYYIVMEYVDGQNLKEAIKEKGQFPITEGITIFLQILSAMGYAHTNGVIHRDIKPSNIFLSRDHTAKICDFGIAKVKGIEGLTKAGTALGSPLYSSPEQLLGKVTDARTDIYSLGITFYQMLTGTLPFTITGTSSYDLLKQALEAVPYPPTSFNAAISAPLEAIILKSIAKNADERFQTTTEFAEALQAFLHSSVPAPVKTPGVAPVVAVPVTPFTPATPPSKKWPPDLKVNIKFNRQPNQKHRLAILVMSVVLVILILFLIFSLNRNPAIKTSSSDIAAPVSTTSSSNRVSSSFPNTIQSPAVSQPPVTKSTPAQKPVSTPGSTPGTGSGNTSSTTTTEIPTQPSTTTSEPTTTAEPTPDLPVSTKIGPNTTINPINALEIHRKIENLIQNGEYYEAIQTGLTAEKKGIRTSDVLVSTAKAHYYYNQVSEAQTYFFKALDIDPPIRLPILYQTASDQIIEGTLNITRKNLSFSPRASANDHTAFLFPISSIDQVSRNFTRDIARLFKRRKNRGNPAFAIKTQNGQKFTLMATIDDRTLRSFIADMIYVLWERRK